jgi:pSer/pThr/pTyr-binding forkhead associated (FHA) protein
MWLLSEVTVPGTPAELELQVYTLCARADGSVNVACVGRKAREPAPSAGNIILENQSISRVHAEVHCHAQQKDESCQKLQIVDKSKFGSFVNGAKVAKGVPVQLRDGDEVRFGTVAKAATFRAQWKPIRILCSSVNSTIKIAMRKLCPALGGHILKAWDSRVTHLVQDKIVMTEKAMLALIDGVPIVTHEFFDAVLGRAEAKTPLPNPQAFLPEVSQGTTQSVTKEDFEVNHARKTMLAGHLFFFFTDKQHKKHSSVITHASGEAMVLRSESPHTADPVQAVLDSRGTSRPSAEKIFFIDVEEASQLSQSLSTEEAHGVAAVRQRCAEHGVRKVRDTEVLQAILRGQVVAELADDTLSQVTPAHAASPDAKTAQLGQTGAGTKRSASEDAERPVPAASRRRTKATPSHMDVALPDAEAGKAKPSVKELDASPIVDASTMGDESPGSRPSVADKAEVERSRTGGRDIGAGSRTRSASVSPVPQSGTPAASPARPRSGSDKNAAPDVDAADDGTTAPSAQLDHDLVDRIENAPSVSPVAAARRKPPPLSSTIFSQPSSRQGTTPDQRTAHGVNASVGARARNLTDRDVIVDDGLLTKDLESAQPVRKNFKRFKKKGRGAGAARPRARPVIKMRLHNADELSRAIDQVDTDGDDDSDDDNNLFGDDVPRNRQPAKRRRAGGSGIVQRRRGR